MIDHHWSEAEAQQVAEMLTQFCTPAEVAASVGCEESDLDALSLEAFELPFADVADVYAAQGRALLRRSLFQQAMDGNIKAIDMLGREHLGLDPVERRKQVKSADSDNGEDAGQRAGTLSLLQGRRKNRRTGTED